MLTEKVELQFIYGNCVLVDILANITNEILIADVDAGFLALYKLIEFAIDVSVGNKLLNITNYETLPLLAGTLNVHELLQIWEILVVIKFDWL